jgi:hypothetical protein
MLFERIRGVVKTGTPVIYITHRLAELRHRFRGEADVDRSSLLATRDANGSSEALVRSKCRYAAFPAAVGACYC